MSTIEKKLITQITERISSYALDPDRALVAAFSGGPDSTALLELLVRAAESGQLSRRVEAIYVNHHLRSTAELEGEISDITEYCRRRGIPLTIADLGEQTVYQHAQKHRLSTEEAARQLRYEMLLEYAAGGAVLTAHTLDDQIETVIMRVFSGSGIEGLTGIPEQRDPYYRPLLGIPKSRLMNFLETAKVPFCDDSTNRTGIYRRNQLRELMPQIETVFPGCRRAVEALREKMEWAEASLEYDQDSLPVTGDSARGTAEFSLKRFTALTAYQRMMHLYACWNRFVAPQESQLPFDSIRAFLLWCRQEESAASRTPVFDVFQSTIEVKGDRVFWSRTVAQKEKKGYLKAVTARDTLLYDGVYLCVRESDRFTPDTLGLIDHELSPPILVRSSKEGDVMVSTGGSKSLGKLLSDWKVPRHQRWMIPVIEDRKGIQAVLGAALGYYDRAAAVHTRTIREDERYLLCSLEILGSEG